MGIPDGQTGDDALDDPARVAHDLKNYMGVILGFTELLLAGVTPDDPRREDLLEIQKAGHDALGLAPRITAMTRARRET